MSLLKFFNDRLLSGQQAFSCLLFVALTSVVSLQVLSRYVWETPFLWSEEIARFVFFWVALMGGAISVRNRRHFVIDLSGASMGDAGPSPTRGGRTLDLLRDVLMCGFCVLMTWVSIGFAESGSYRTAANSHVSFVWVYAALPVTFATMSLYTLQQVLESFAALRRPGDLGDKL